jgi:predicted metal-binding protein
MDCQSLKNNLIGSLIMDKKYVVIVQCHIVKERCSGYLCEKVFNNREDRFSGYSGDMRMLSITCGGCCGLAVHRKLSNLLKLAKKQEGIEKDQIIVHLSSCITNDSYHGPPCPHLAYLKELITKLGLEIVCGTRISKKSESLRQAEIYRSDPK